MKGKLIISAGLLSFLLLTGCGVGTSETSQSEVTGEESLPEQSEATENEGQVVSTDLGDYHIQFSGEVKEEGNQFIIDGQSNLIPGSRIVGEVIVDDGETIYSDTSELIKDDGSFYMELEHHQYGEAEIVVRFDFDSVQEDEVKRHYGDKGQKLEGPFIYKHKASSDILKKAETRVDYNPDETTAMILQAPEWYDLPEDYGDPRVWIEVDEITEDGEYFYIHGRSNLLEGSELKVEYQYNRDTTAIKPDGSFDFKFDYEYLEDKDIVITFSPSNFQWNEIEEAYGAKGQKLIGNLVVTNQFNTDTQYIEKRIPWDHQKSSQTDENEDEAELDSEQESNEAVEDEEE
ncbi:hypothetical protein [Halalkalibacterium halodurans]|uniref:hypothetical protein n=1 Tax=Halalkalibacterium halodurans TaxID=86665 RepID=UPI002AA96F10|nr:hypothetical protein [Halalkalibacterium halodurans]MDY7221510.1 hypothetical protein [Halalkalibacterium halodurans]MDY7240786.1 hypothetical protein [Halalkalibacterium halodurans]MED4164565.1 hypothetical protein [Halalkalibacterium halodurans]